MPVTLTRRNFLSTTGGALAATTLSGLGLAAGGVPKQSLGARNSTKKRVLHKAIMYATIGFKGSVLEKFQAVKAAGFEGVEQMSHMNQDEVLKAFEVTGLKPASVCCATPWNKTLSDADERVRKEGLEGLVHSLLDAKRYGASSVLLVPGVVKPGVVSYEECFERSVAEIKKAVPVATDLGIKIAVEN